MPSEAISDVIEDARRGDKAALRALFNRFSGPVFRFAAHSSGNRATAKSLTQDIFRAAFDRLDELASAEGFRAWLFRIAAAACRKQGAGGPLAFDVLRFEEHEIAEPLLRATKLQAIAAALKEIGAPELREAVERYYGDESATAAAIAERLELSQSEVAAALTRVRHHIRRRALKLLREHAQAVEVG